MKRHLLSVASKVCCHTLVLLLGAVSLSASDPATYAGLKPDEFMRNWLVLKPIPVSAEKPGSRRRKSRRKPSPRIHSRARAVKRRHIRDPG